jgi:hypothetical protein
MTATKTFSQFRAGGEHKGRTATLKGVAYCTGHTTVDERNSRHFDYGKQGRGERILKAGIFLPKDFPAHLDRHRFKSEADFQQAVWTSLARFEEKQRRQHAGRTGHGKPIISRHDVLLLDKRVLLDKDGKMRPDGINHAYQIVTDFLRENYTRKGLVASFAIHDQDGNGNFHVHIISSYRTLTADGWGERKRPFGKNSWAVWTKEKQSSLFKIQTRKLEALGVIPKIERTSNKRETLTAWKTGRGIMTRQDFRPSRKFTDEHFRSAAPLSNGNAVSARMQTTNFNSAPTAFGQYAASAATTREDGDEITTQQNPEPVGGGDRGGGGGGGDSGGGDFVYTMLLSSLGAAEEKLRTAKLTGIGIPAAQAAVDAARLNLKNHGRAGKGKAKGGASKRKFKRHNVSSHQKL